MTNYLAVCSMGITRSVFLKQDISRLLVAQSTGGEVRNAGVTFYANTPLTQELVDWSNIILFAEEEIEQEAIKRFRFNGQKTIDLDIQDFYEQGRGCFAEDKYESVLDMMTNTGMFQEIRRIQAKQEIKERWNLRMVLDSRNLGQYIVRG